MNRILAALLFSASAASMAQATVVNYSFVGSFLSDDDSRTFSLTVPVTSVITIQTLSYGGGTNSALASIASGGFDPRITWFQSDGTQIGSDNGGHCLSTNLYLGACADDYIQTLFPAGDYTIVLTVDGNVSLGDLGDGFSQTGNGNFTATGSCTQFCESFGGSPLDGHFALDIRNVTQISTATPEPVTFLLSGSTLGLLALVRRRVLR